MGLLLQRDTTQFESTACFSSNRSLRPPLFSYLTSPPRMTVGIFLVKLASMPKCMLFLHLALRLRFFFQDPQWPPWVYTNRWTTGFRHPIQHAAASNVPMSAPYFRTFPLNESHILWIASRFFLVTRSIYVKWKCSGNPPLGGSPYLRFPWIISRRGKKNDLFERKPHPGRYIPFENWSISSGGIWVQKTNWW